MYPSSVNGGTPGIREVCETSDATQAIAGSKLEDLQVEVGDPLHFIARGGGENGGPVAREPPIVAKEVDQGLVMASGARRYGVVRRDGRIDEAIAELRAAMRPRRGNEVPLIDLGRILEQRGAACEAETGLSAPKPSVWQH